MTNTWPNKDPDEVLDYSIDWSAQMAADGDTIASAEWIVPAELTKGAEVVTGNIVTVWLSGGTAARSHFVTSRITTTAGRVMDRSARLLITNL